MWESLHITGLWIATKGNNKEAAHTRLAFVMLDSNSESHQRAIQDRTGTYTLDMRMYAIPNPIPNPSYDVSSACCAVLCRLSNQRCDVMCCVDCVL